MPPSSLTPVGCTPPWPLPSDWRATASASRCSTCDPWCPLDLDAVLASVRKTGRVLVLTEDCRTGSAAAEIITLITDHAFDALQAAPVRVCAEDCPLPYSEPLQSCALPSVGRVVTALRGLVE